MTKYIKLKIPFATKSLIKNKDGFKMKGCAFYIFDLENQIYVDEYIEIIESNFRITDKAMIKPTEYYKIKKVKFFRDNFLDKYSNVDPEKINKITYYDLPKSEINKINQYIKSLNTTIRVMFSFFSGSNITGAETKNTSTPMVCINPNYFGCNFANVMKKYEPNDSNKIKLNWEEIKEITLDDMIANNYIKDFSLTFFEYNQDLEYRDKLPDDILSDENIFESQNILHENNKFKFKENQTLWIESFLNKNLDHYEEFVKNKQKLSQKLHSFYVSNIYYCIKEKIIPNFHTVTKFNLKQICNAHIIPKNELIKKGTKKSFEDAINPFNCLRIDQSYHSLWDKHEIEFDIQGNIVQKGKIIKPKYLDMDLINKNPKTLYYFEKYLKASKDHI